jgi:prepilin-type N-terminal cleavage/methylation domain-containing protein/prepilin-type processing-associated H-X9-DG protein
MKTRRKAFTLIELLVVIAIIGVLAALLLPALGGAKARAQGAVCVSNFKQLALAWQMYADDNDGAIVKDALPEANKRFPQPQLPWVAGNLSLGPGNSDNIRTDLLVDRRHAAFAPYIQNPAIYKCPSDKSTALVLEKRFNRVRSYQLGGGWRFQPFSTPGYARQITKIAVAVRPAGEMTFIEGHADTIQVGRFPSPRRIPSEEHVDYPTLAFLQNLPGSRHSGSGAVAFGDGRVEMHKWRDPRTTPPETGVGPWAPGEFYLYSVCDPVNQDALWIDEHAQLLGNRDARRPQEVVR